MVIWNSLSTTISASPNLLIQNEQKIKNMNTRSHFLFLRGVDFSSTKPISVIFFSFNCFSFFKI